MIALICTMEPARISWLPQFLKHYQALGVEKFFLSLQFEPDADPAKKQTQKTRFEKLLKTFGIHEAYYLEKSFDAHVIRDHHDALQDAYITADDWVVWTDSDEFQLYPRPLDEMIRHWSAAGLTHAEGAMLDRVASDGSLPAFNPAMSLWAQYPLTCVFAFDVTNIVSRKVTIARGDLCISRGNHFLAKFSPNMLTESGARRFAEKPQPETQYVEGWVQIHHFKWDATVLERLRFRVTPDWRAKCSWWTQSEHLLDYFEKNNWRFDMKNLNLRTMPGNKLLFFEGETLHL